jgi:hypothetical protein
MKYIDGKEKKIKQLGKYIAGYKSKFVLYNQETYLKNIINRFIIRFIC